MKINALILISLVALLMVSSAVAMSGLTSGQVSEYCQKFCRESDSEQELKDCQDFCMMAA